MDFNLDAHVTRVGSQEAGQENGSEVTVTLMIFGVPL